MTAQYENPLCKRYASRAMGAIFSDDRKFATWRRLWIALAEGQQALGLGISDAQIAEMKAHADAINYETADQYERQMRHDVMAHIKAFGVQCPQAAPIIHLGATSCYVGDNTDIIIQRDALRLVRKMLLNVIAKLADFAERYKALPCLAYTHFQAAQPTTVGKRATLWLQDLLFDLSHIDFALGNLKLLGCKGTTGTGASFLALFDGDHEKVRQLEEKIAAKMGFAGVYPISGQTYSRKIDYYTLAALSGIAQSAAKFSNDLRLLSHLKEVDEPFETGQVGSSAMAYKRNPMRSERIASLARYVMVDALNPALTAGAQWFERTLDDSANRRMAIPEAFLAVDAILSLMLNIVTGMTVYPNRIEKHLQEELPFLATENILMHGVKKGGDRQQLHERIRIHAVAAASQIKQFGSENDLLARIADDAQINISAEEIADITQAENFTGCAAAQVESFLAEVTTLLENNQELLGMEVEILC